MAGYGVGAYPAGAYGPQTGYRGGQQMYQGSQGRYSCRRLVKSTPAVTLTRDPLAITVLHP